jgi:hypothetical protein
MHEIRQAKDHRMGIVAYCPNHHRVKVKDDLAGRKGICPTCGTRFRIPLESQAEPPEAHARSATATAPLDPLPFAPLAAIPVAEIISFDEALAATLPRAVPLTPPAPG